MVDVVVDPGVPAQPPTTRGGPPVRDVVAGALLAAAALVAVGGSFTSLDRAVDHVGPGRTQIIETSPWYYRAGPVEAYRLEQYFGVALVVGGVLALALGLCLLTGQARRVAAVRPAAVAAAALLFGAVLATVMSVLDDLQWDALAAPGEHVTHPSLGFWLLSSAGTAALVGLGFALAGFAGRAATTVDAEPAPEPADLSRADVRTPAYGLRVAVLPPSAPDPPR